MTRMPGRSRCQSGRFLLAQIVCLLALLGVAGHGSALMAQTTVLRVQSATIAPGQNGTVTVQMDAQGVENSLGFSIQFDPARLTYVTAALGGGATGASLIPNTSQAASGQIGYLIGLNAGVTFPSGTLDLLVLTFTPISGTSGAPVALTIGNTPVFFEISSAEGNPVTATSTNGTVCVTPELTAQPSGGTICSGMTHALSATAAGVTPLTYTWYQGAAGDTSTPAPGGTNSPNYTTPALTATTSYWVQVGNACGTVNSNTATVTVRAATQITGQPQSVVIDPNTSTTLTVTATGDGVLAYQWYQGASGTTTTPVGTNANTFTTPNLTAATSYWVRVTGGCGTADSQTAEVSVGTAPEVTNIEGPRETCAGTGVTLRMVVTGTAPFTYQWYGSPDGQVYTAISGAQSVSYTTPALSETRYFQGVATNAMGSDQGAVKVTVLAPPEITAMAGGQTLRTGERASFWVECTGHEPIYFQWYEGETGDTSKPVIGAAQSTFTTPALRRNAKFWVRVSSDCGVADSAAATAAIENTYIIPHSLETADWTTEYRVACAGEYTAPVRFDAYGADGALLETVTVDGPPVRGLSSWHPSGLFSPSTLQVDHWVKATSGADIRILTNFASADGNGGRTAVPAVAAGNSKILYPCVTASAGGWYSGVVLVNDGGEAAAAHAEGFDASGAKLGDALIPVPAKGKKLWMLEQIFPETVDFTKITSLLVTSEQPMVGMEAIGNYNWEGVAGILASPLDTGAAMAEAAKMEGASPVSADAANPLTPGLLFAENQVDTSRMTGLSIIHTGGSGNATTSVYDDGGTLLMKTKDSLALWEQVTKEPIAWFGYDVAEDAAYYLSVAFPGAEGLQMVYSTAGVAVPVFSGLPCSHYVYRWYALPDTPADASRSTKVRLTNLYRDPGLFPPSSLNVALTVYDAEGAVLTTGLYTLENGRQVTVDIRELVGSEASRAAWATASGSAGFMAHAVLEDAEGRWLTMYLGLPTLEPAQAE